MNKQAIQKLSFCTLFLALFAIQLLAQPTVIRQCGVQTPIYSTSYTPNTVIPTAATFDFSAYPGFVVSDIKVSVTWSKGHGDCSSINTSTPTDLSEIGFRLAPSGAPSQILGMSAYDALDVSTSTSTYTSMFSGTNPVSSITTNFVSHGGISQLPSRAPVPNGNYMTNSNGTNNFAGIIGSLATSLSGQWTLVVRDDEPSTTGNLCIESFCVEVSLCNSSSFIARCSSNAYIAIGTTGIGYPTFETINASSDTSCGLKSIAFTSGTVTNPSYTCAQVGTTVPITMTLTSNLNTTSTCSTTATIRDVTAPVIDCTPRTIYLDSFGRDTIRASSIIATDDCTTSSSLTRLIRLPNNTTQAFRAYNCNHLAGSDVIFVVRDAAGNESSCVVPLTIRDTVAPRARCKPFTVYLDSVGSATLNAVDINNGSTDNCGITGITVNNSASVYYTCNDIGSRTATLTVRDNANNTSSCSADITVIDNIAPIARCKSITVNLDASGNATVTPAQINNGSTDNCTPTNALTLLINNANSLNLNCNNITSLPAVPPVTTTLTVRDARNNTSTCTADITVVDNTPPTALCRPVSLAVDNNGQATITPILLNNGSFDNCTASSNLVYSLTSASVPSITVNCTGTIPTSVILNVTDANGNTASCNSQLTLQDNIAPIANCITSIDVYLDTIGHASLSALAINNGSTDNCGIALQYINNGSTAQYGCADIGIPQTAVLYIEDNAGNFDECNTIVNVFDNIPPVARCQNIDVYLNNTGSVRVYAQDIDNAILPSSDNCGSVSLTINSAAFIEYTNCPIGFNPVVLTATDDQGLTHTCPAQINIIDTIRPTAVCRPYTAVLPSTGQVVVNATQIRDAQSRDNCAITSSLIDGLNSRTFSCANIGVNNVTLTLSDASGNIGTCATTVTVVDNIAPTARCRTSYTAILNAAGQATVTPTNINNNSIDNCAITEYRINNNTSVTYNCTHVNPATPLRATLTLRDSSGNISSCMTDIIVEDRIPPVAICQSSMIIDLPATTSNTSVTVPAINFNNGSTDNCNNLTYTINGQQNITFDCSQVGPNNYVTLTVADNSNNSNTCITRVEVRDLVAPIADCNSTITAFVDNTGTATITANQVNRNSIDNCSNITLTLNDSIFQCVPNSHTVTLTVTDDSGNNSTCTSIISIVDSIAPIVTSCTSTLTVDLDNTGNATVNANTLATATDNCGIPTYTINNNPSINFSCSDAGRTIPVTIVITDASGNMATCASDISIRDVTPPSAICQSPTIYLDGDGLGTLTAAQVNNNSSDICGIQNMTINNTNFTCTNLNTTNTVILTVTDANGLTNTCTASITILDTIRPTAICNNPTVYLDNTGIANVTTSMINNNSNDNCGIVFSSINNQQNVSYTCTNINTTNNITFLVRDASGNTNTCQASVTVVDSTAPVITCNTVTIALSPVGAATVNATELATTTDICGATLSINGLTNRAFDCTNVGNNIITVTAVDPSGNSSTCDATVEIIDNTRPTAICRVNTVYLNSVGTTPIDPLLIDNGSNDACGIASMVISPATVDCQQLAIDPNPTVTLTVTDVNGNISACSVPITIVDSIAPTAICAPFTAYLSTTGSVNVIPSDINNGSSDACGINPLSYRVNGANQVTYTCADAGQQTITLSVSDIYNNTSTCQTTVNVVDTIKPVANCYTQIVAQLDNTGVAVVTGTMLDSLSSDICGIDNTAFLINGSPNISYTCNQVNTIQNAVLTVFDINGNSNTCSARISIQDNIPPIANCVTTPINLNLNAISGQVSLNATALNNGSTDNCGGIASYLINGVTRTTFNCTNVGSNFITLTVTDNNGNSSTCQSEVIIHDITAPVAHCQSAVQLYLPNIANGTITVNALDLDNGSTDNCGIVSYLINGQPSLTFDCSQINTPTAVVFTVSDLEGNTAVCNSVITIRDTVSPVALCTPGIISATLDNFGLVTLTPAMVNAGSYDNCGVADITINNTRQIIYTCADLGSHTVTLRVRDANGLESTCTAEVLVEDNVAPTAICYQTITVDLDLTGQATILAEALDSASIDACLPITRFINNAPSISFDCQDVGINPTTLTIYDASNNMASCITNIIVRDAIAPTAICNNITAALDANGEIRVTAQSIANNSIDNCGINTYSFATGRDIIYSCDDIGTHTVTVTVTDLYGNTNQCNADVTIVDNIAPTIICRPTATINLTNTNIGYLNANILVVNGSITDNCNIDAINFSRDFVTCADGNSIVPITVTVTDQSGNVNSCISEVTVNLQMPVITSVSEICAGETLPLQATIPTGTTNYTVAWSGPNGFTANTATTSIANVEEIHEGAYIVTITPTTTGCTASDTINVIVHTVNVPIINVISPTCENNEARFSIDNLADYFPNNSLSFEWFKGGISLGQTDSIFIIPNTTLADTGSYTVVVTMNDCPKTSASFELEIMTLPTAPLLSSNIPCEMDVLELESITDGLRTYTYVWSGPNGFVSTIANPNITDASQNNAGLYNLLITDQYGCTATNDISVTVAPKPQAPSLVYNTPLCTDDLLEITDTNTYLITPTAYNWILADATTASTTIPQLVVTTPIIGAYSLVVNMDGCFSDTSTISVDYQPNVVAINDYLDLEFRDSIFNFSVASNDVVNNGYSVSIIQMPRKGNVSLNTDGTLNYIAGYSAFGRDTITYTICDINCPDNCDTAQVYITIVADFECYIPEAITPNTDGINDVWNINCINDYPNREVTVFSRWGELVYKGNGNDFDGKYKGNDLPDGTYFYILKLNDTTHVPNDTFKGHLIIHR